VTDNPLVDLLLTFARLSLVAIGGLNSVIPEMQRQVVDVHGWTTAAQLAQLIALAQASPGPNGLVASLVGWQVAGPGGFMAATIGVNVPPAVLAFGLSRVRRRLAHSRLLRAVQHGLVPIVVGLILASGFVIAQATDDTPVEVGMTVAVAVLVWRTRINPLWLLSGAALVGLAGLASG
jgi:chromate transporter